jgi:hypothetical protein
MLPFAFFHNSGKNIKKKGGVMLLCVFFTTIIIAKGGGDVMPSAPCIYFFITMAITRGRRGQQCLCVFFSQH